MKKTFYTILTAVMISSLTCPVYAKEIETGLVSNEIVFEEGNDYYHIENVCTILSKHAFQNNLDHAFLRNLIKNSAEYEFTGIDIAQQIVFSEESNSLFSDNQSFIELCYRTILNRTPSENELEKWMDCLKIGMSKEYIFQSLVKEKEFCDFCLDNEIRVGSYNSPYYRDYNYETTKFLNDCFLIYYGRNADYGSLEDYCKQVSEGISYKEIIASFIESEEFLNQEWDNSTFFVNTYLLFFDKIPNTHVKNTYINKLNQNEITYIDLIDEFVNSKDFISRMKLKYVNVISFGDSIAAGSGVNENQTYQSLVAEYLEVEDITYAYGGNTLATNTIVDSLVDKAMMLPESDDYAIILLEAGTNDFVTSTKLGEVGSRDTTTLCGSLSTVIDILQRKMPNADIVVLSPARTGYDSQINSMTLTLDTYCNAIHSVANYKNCRYIDLYYNENLAFSEDINKYTFDGLHLKENAHKMLADVIIDELF